MGCWAHQELHRKGEVEVGVEVCLVARRLSEVTHDDPSTRAQQRSPSPKIYRVAAWPPRRHARGSRAGRSFHGHHVPRRDPALQNTECMEHCGGATKTPDKPQDWSGAPYYGMGVARRSAA